MKLLAQITSLRSQFTLATLSLASLLGFFSLHAQQERAANMLPLNERTNGEKTLEAFNFASKQTQDSSVAIYNSKRELIILATVISEDGLLLSKLSEFKASEVPTEELIVRDARFQRGSIELIATDAEADLALLKTDLEGLKPVRWITPEAEPEIGDWTYTHTSRLRNIFNGNISANRRPISSAGAVLGISLESDKKNENKPKVKAVSPGSAADLGGVLVGDYIVGINNERIEDFKKLQEVMRELVPGSLAYIMVERDGVTYQTQVELGFRSVLEQQSSGNARISGLVSTRQSGFGRIFQHTTMLTPPMMGSPAYNLQGECIGINIARFDRTAILTLTPEQIYASTLRLEESTPLITPLREKLEAAQWAEVLNKQAQEAQETNEAEAAEDTANAEDAEQAEEAEEAGAAEEAQESE